MAAAFTTTASSVEGQMFELARHMQELELAIDEATRPNNVTLAIDVEAQTAQIVVTLPVVLSGTGNQVAFTAVPYLA